MAAHGAIMERRPGIEPIQWMGVPQQLHGRVSAVVRTPFEADALVEFYGSPNWMPAAPLLILVPGYAPILVQAASHLTAAQLRAVALETWEELLEKVADLPDRGRFGFREFQALTHAEKLARLDSAHLARIVAEKNNAVLNRGTA